MSRRVCITLMGMSGVGKTYFSHKLKEWGWYRYSADDEIGRILLNDTRAEISMLTDLLGKIGNPDLGGYPINKFKTRQRMYGHAEATVSYALGAEKEKTDKHFVYDSSGSLCELEDDLLLSHIDENSRVVYIHATKEHEEEVLQRALDAPKPIYYPPSKFDGWVRQYLEENNLKTTDEMEPDAFFRWVFPILFKERLPKYEQIASKYGVTISSDDLARARDESDFLELIDSKGYADS